MARLQCRAALGSSIAPTLRAPYSLCLIGAKLSSISTARHRATRRSAKGLDSGIADFAIAPPTLAARSPFAWPSRGHTEAVRSSVGSFRFRAAADRKLTDWSLDVEFDSRHLCEQIDVRDSNRTSAEPHVGRHQVECLRQDTDVLQNQRIGDRAILP